MVEHADREENANQPAHPWRDFGEHVEQAKEKQRTEAIGDRGEALPERMAAMERAAGGFEQAGVDDDENEQDHELKSFEDGRFAFRELNQVRDFALHFAPADQAVALSDRDEDHHREQIREEDV